MFASEPVIADLNGDGKAEVVFTTFGNPNSAAGYLVVLDADGKLLHEVPFSTAARNGNGNGAPTVAVGDADDDGQVRVDQTVSVR